MTEEADHVTAPARELRYLRKLAKLLVEVDLDLLSDERTFSESYVKLSDAQELAKKALDTGKLSRAEIIKKARTVAAGTRSVAAKKRHAMVMTEIKIIQQELGPAATIKAICEALDARGVKPAKSKVWNVASVRYILGRQ
jgi:hypothetical protein